MVARNIFILPIIVVFVLPIMALSVSIFLLVKPQQGPSSFGGSAALELIRQQLSFGPRFVGSLGHETAVEWLETAMKQYSHETIVQRWTQRLDGKTVTLANIIGRFNPKQFRRVLLVTHYDSRQFAANDKLYPNNPVPGANNSASGVAVLLELAHTLRSDSGQARMTSSSNVGVDIALFDGEEWDVDHPSGGVWRPLGSTYFAQHLKELYPQELPIIAVDLDLVCAKDMALHQEQSSLERARSFVEKFWSIAHPRWPNYFSDSVRWNILDDHTILNAAGIPAILLIDYDYPWIHTTSDTIDKCGARSLEAVGDSVSRFVESLK